MKILNLKLKYKYVNFRPYIKYKYVNFRPYIQLQICKF